MDLPNYSKQLLQQLHTLCKEQQFSDCTIYIGTLHFRAHKLVLAAASLLFKSLLESTDTISIDASVVTPEEFSLLLEMMYSGKLPPGKHNLTKVISVADSLQMFDVAVSCKNLLTEIMSHSAQNQKLKDVVSQPKPVTRPEILPKQDSGNTINNIANETPPVDKIAASVNMVGLPMVSAKAPEADKCTEMDPPPGEPEADGTSQSPNVTDSALSTETVQSMDTDQAVVSKASENLVEYPTGDNVNGAAELDAASVLEKSDTVAGVLEADGSPRTPTDGQKQTEQEIHEDSATRSERSCDSPPVSSAQVDSLEEDSGPAMKKRRLNDTENEKGSGELDFLIRYESIFSEALSDPQSVLENLKKCQHIEEKEKQVVMECCQAEEGRSTFAKLLEKVRDGQSIIVDTVLALLKLCRDTHPYVDEALREKDPKEIQLQEEDSLDAESPAKDKTLFDLLLEHKEELIQCITEVSPIIECLDTAEEGFLTNIEKQVILDCCEGRSHKEAMDRLVRKASETKTLSPDSLVKLLLAVREAFPDLHTLLELLEPLSKKSFSKAMLSTADYGLELLRQYQENFCEVVTNSEIVLSGISSATNLTSYEREVMEDIVKKNSNTQIFSTLMSLVLEEQTMTAMAVWQLLLAMQETNLSLKSLIEEIRKEPGAEAFFYTITNRENEAAEILVRHCDLIVQAVGQNDILGSLPSEDTALSDLVKELLNPPAHSEDNELHSKLVLSSAFHQNVPVMKFCHLLFSAQDSVPDLQPIIKDLEELGLFMKATENTQTVSKWNVTDDSQLVVAEEVEERNDEDAKDEENEMAESKKDQTESAQDKESARASKKSFICQLCDKIFLFRCRLEVHMKRCRMAKKNPLQCKDCNEVLKSRKQLDRHREEVHGYSASRSSKGKRKLLVTCDICGKEFAHPSGLQYHKRTEHFDEKPFSCNECGAKFAANSTLKNHQRLHTGERPFVCKHCHMTFTQAAALSYHTKKKHSEGKMYVCQYCDAVFAQSIELTRHVRTHTGDKPYVCRECGRGFSQANGLSIHLRTFHNIEDPYDCQKCRMSFPTLEENRQHIQVVHSKEYHPCPTCEKIFSAPSLLERHIVTHVGGKPYNCGICDKAYQQLSGLWYHNRTHHPDLFAAQNHRTSKFSVQCNMCEQYFSNTAILQKHAKIEHAEGKVYECDKCKLTYPTPAALKVHVKCKHSGSQPFQCLYCSECFQFPGALQHHVSTDHFNETESTFGCELCGELFTNQSQLERHYETDHLTETHSSDAQVVQVIQDQVASTEQVITLDESHLAGSQVIVALPDSQTNQATTELVAVSMEDLLDGTVTLICGDSTVTGVTQRTQS
ncbi:zinc finger and BTB domain-containing protein 40 [Spea bombifrons]|uniref:zinc finger and BTB domain-containing protein 40 n=1 Tax=Spea bombifrons TaxID=233779 RepID=UPI00234B17EE|nr:zinc finger and BTB domain-containing protein 40 [Spea bombifrons]